MFKKKSKQPEKKGGLSDVLERQQRRREEEERRAARQGADDEVDEEAARRARRNKAKQDKEAKEAEMAAANLLDGYRTQHHQQGNRFDRAIRRWAPRDEVYHCCCIPRRICFALLCLLVVLIGAGVAVYLVYGDDIASLFE